MSQAIQIIVMAVALSGSLVGMRVAVAFMAKASNGGKPASPATEVPR